MIVHIRYHNVLRHRTGVKEETVRLPNGAHLGSLLESLAERHGQALRDMVFAPDGAISTHLVVMRNGKLVPHDSSDEWLSDGDELMLFPVISGG
jgi:MoaD family protein